MRSIIVFIIALIFVATATGLSAAGKKKVLLLDFVSIDKNADYRYLETSITKAIRSELQKKFVYQELPRNKWIKTMKQNHLFRDDLFTKSAAMQMGLYGGQDVVIGGGFSLQAATAQSKTETIVTKVYILDISRKQVIAEWEEISPANNSLFKAVKRIAGRVAEKAKQVLPNEEEWLAGGTSKPLVIFANYNLGLRLGAGTFIYGYGDRVSANLPTFTALLRANLPVLYDPLAFELNVTLMSQEPASTGNPALEGLSVETTRYLTGFAFAYDYSVTGDIMLIPKIGTGYVLQTTTVTGDRNENLNNSHPYLMLGVDVAYDVNQFVAAVFGLQSYVEFESDATTTYNQLSLGMNLKF